MNAPRKRRFFDATKEMQHVPRVKCGLRYKAVSYLQYNLTVMKRRNQNNCKVARILDQRDSENVRSQFLDGFKPATAKTQNRSPLVSSHYIRKYGGREHSVGILSIQCRNWPEQLGATLRRFFRESLPTLPSRFLRTHSGISSLILMYLML